MSVELKYPVGSKVRLLPYDVLLNIWVTIPVRRLGGHIDLLYLATFKDKDLIVHSGGIGGQYTLSASEGETFTVPSEFIDAAYSPPPKPVAAATGGRQFTLAVDLDAFEYKVSCPEDLTHADYEIITRAEAKANLELLRQLRGGRDE